MVWPGCSGSLSDLPEGEILSPLHGRRFDAWLRVPRVRIVIEPSVRWNPRSGAGASASRPQALAIAPEAQPEGARPKGGPGERPSLQDRVGSAGVQPRDGPAPRRCAAGRSGRPQEEARGRLGREGAPPKPSRARIPYRNVHQAYLKIFLLGAVGSAYSAMDEWAIEKHCEKSSWEEVLKAVRSRKREIEFLKGVLEDGGVLIHCYSCSEGYSRLSLIRASSVSKRHSILAPFSWRRSCQAATSASSVWKSGTRRSRHWRLSTLNSISAMFSHEPCLGV